MKKFLLALAFCLAPSLVFGQCTGVFPANTLCGNLSASPAPPSQFSASGTVVGPGSSVVGEIAVWANTGGTQLGDATGISAAAGGPFTINLTSNTINQGIVVNGTGSQSSTVTTDFAYNKITITNDGLTVNSPGLYTYGQYTELDTQGGTGGKYGSRSLVNLTANSTTGGDLVGQSGWCITNKTNGSGSCYGGEYIGHLFSGATGYSVVSGAEYDAIIDSGASTSNRWGISIVGNGSAQGSTSDAAVEIGGVTSAGRFKNGVFLDSIHGQAPLSTTGCAFCNDGASATITTGIDLSSYTISGNAWKFANSQLTGAGELTVAKIDAFLLAGTISGQGNSINNIVIGSLTPQAAQFTTVLATSTITGSGFIAGASTGVSCSGSPTSSFVSINGIVTHC